MKILGIIIAVLVIGGGVWFMSADKSVTPTENPLKEVLSTETESTVSEGIKVEGSIEDLAKKGGKYICTFDMKDPNTESSGTVYIEGEKFRGDFKSNVKAIGQTIESHSISDASFVYTWTSASPIAMKTPVVKGSNGSGGTMKGNMDFTAQEAGTSWECVSSKFDTSVFSLPAGIQFIEAPAF